MLRQVALTWAATTGAPVPVPLVLARVDDGQTAPDVLIDQELARLHPSIMAAMSPLFSTPEHNLAKNRGRWGLLVEGLDELPPARQKAWRTTLQRVPTAAPGTHMVVAVAMDEQEWPGFTALRVAAPSPTIVQEWVKRLSDAAQQPLLLNALRPDGTLELVGEQLVEVALLAWVTKRTELPHSRAELYGQAAVAMLRMFPDAGVSMDRITAPRRLR